MTLTILFYITLKLLHMMIYCGICDSCTRLPIASLIKKGQSFYRKRRNTCLYRYRQTFIFRYSQIFILIFVAKSQLVDFIQQQPTFQEKDVKFAIFYQLPYVSYKVTDDFLPDISMPCFSRFLECFSHCMGERDKLKHEVSCDSRYL